MKRTFLKDFAHAAIVAALALGCAGSDQSSSPATREIAKYPYRATAAREQRIRSNVDRVTQGMTSIEVASILGEPDEVRALYEPIMKNPDVIGTTHWYVIQRLVRDGSVRDKAQIAVRIALDLKGRVLQVDSLGFDSTDGAPQ